MSNLVYGFSTLWERVVSWFDQGAKHEVDDITAPPSESSEPCHIAIIGAGIGGLALAIALTRHGVPFTVYESAAAYATVGAGVGIGPNAMRAMDMIDERFRGEYDKVCIGNLSPEKEHVMMEAAMIEDGLGANRGWQMRPWGSQSYTRTAAHRKDLLDIMTTLMPEERVRFKKRIVGLTEVENKVELRFEDGDRIKVSAVIGCDGIKGFTRGHALSPQFEDQVLPKYAHQYAYRAILPIEDARQILGDLANDARMYFGKDVNLSTYIISQGREINVVGFVRDEEPWASSNRVTREVTRERMEADFRCRNVDERLIKLLAWAEPMQWGMFHHPRTSTYHKGLVCLLGDAAHASLPNQAAGAGQGLEDALIMSRVLSICHVGMSTSSSVPEVKKKLQAAFKAYDQVRRPRAQRQVDTSIECGRLYNLQHPQHSDDLGKIVDDLNCRFEWLWDHDLEGDMTLAANLYEEHLKSHT